METNNYCKSLVGLPSPKRPSPDFKDCDDDGDEIAVLLDSVPELDSLFTITKIIGHGTFSSVYLGRCKPNYNSAYAGQHYFALKHIIPTSHPSRVYMELKCLKLMGGKDNIIEATLCLRNMNHIVLVMPYFLHDTFMDYVGTLTIEEICDYLMNLFVALKRVHSYNIIHRDIKPANFLFSRKYRRYALIDFGLAQEGNRGSGERGSVGGEKRRRVSPLAQTPCSSSTTLKLPVKRKLTVSNVSSPDCSSLAKKTRLGSPMAESLVEATVTTKGNSNSPRKPLPTPKGTHKKENTPATVPEVGDPHKPDQELTDSPSKHTRRAEAFRSGKHTLGFNNESQKCPPSVPAGRLPPNVRRSPRKSLNSLCWNSHLKGLNDSFETLLSRTGGGVAENSSLLAASVSSYMQSGSQGGGRATAAAALKDVKRRAGQSVPQASSCRCYGSAKVCQVCLARRNQHAPRAGTPGFRAPEVLLRHPDQRTAVDMWSVGVILLCLLSGRYPFFRAVDDLSSLAEITTVLGTKTMRKASAKLDKLFTASEDVPALDLGKICETFRNANSKTKVTNSNRGGEAKGSLEYCVGCKQVVVQCVCLIPSKNGVSFSDGTLRNPKYFSNTPRNSPHIHRSNTSILSTANRTNVLKTPYSANIFNTANNTSVMNTPSNTNILNTPNSTKILNTPSVQTILNTPSATKILNTPSVTNIFNTPNSTNILNTPSNTTILNTPSVPTILNTPSVTNILNTPSVTNILNTPNSTNILNTPSNTTILNTPSVPTIFNTTSVTNILNTPSGTTILNTPSDTNTLNRPSNTTPLNIPYIPKDTSITLVHPPSSSTNIPNTTETVALNSTKETELRALLDSKQVLPEEESRGTLKESSYPPLVYDLLSRLLDPNPDTRMSAQEGLAHPFIVKYSKK